MANFIQFFCLHVAITNGICSDHKVMDLQVLVGKQPKSMGMPSPFDIFDVDAGILHMAMTMA